MCVHSQCFITLFFCHCAIAILPSLDISVFITHNLAHSAEVFQRSNAVFSTLEIILNVPFDFFWIVVL